MGIEIDISTGCVTKWLIPDFGEINFLGFGCEFTDWFSFFAHERLGGFGIKVKKISIENDDTKVISNWDIKTKKGHFIAIVSFEEKCQNLLVQRLKLTAQPSREISWLGDAVVRFVVPAVEDSKAFVEGKYWNHNNSNTMIETEEREIRLKLAQNKELKFRWSDGFPRCPLSMTPYLYVRDQPPRPKDQHKHSSVSSWVLHGRVLTETPAAFVFRFFRNPGFMWDRAKICKILFNRFNLYKYWRAGEFRVSRRKQTQGLWPFRPGEGVELKVELEAISGEKI